MKKIICLALAAAISLCFVSCKAEDAKNKKSAETEIVTVQAVEDKEEFTFGKTEGKEYINESAGFKITGLDDKWKESTPQQIKSIYGGGIDPSTGKAGSPEGYICDVLYTNSETDSVVSVSLLEKEGEELSDEITVNDGSDSMDGFKDSGEIVTLDFAGRRIPSKKIKYVKEKNIAKVPDITEYELYLLPSGKKQMIRVVIVCFEDKEKAEDILKHFVSLKNE